MQDYEVFRIQVNGKFVGTVNMNSDLVGNTEGIFYSLKAMSEDIDEGNSL